MRVWPKAWSAPLTAVTLGIVLFLLIILLWFIPSQATSFEKVAISISLAGIFSAFYIAIQQQVQLNRLKEIARRSEETARKLRTDDMVRRIVGDFYRFPYRRKQKYVCVFPVEFQSKPLPLINAGDYYALQVLSNRLGEDNLQLYAVTPDRKFPNTIFSGNIIFLCSPKANTILRSKYPPVPSLAGPKASDRNESGKVANKEDPLEKEGRVAEALSEALPCWFVEEERQVGTADNPRAITVSKIRIDFENMSFELTSPAEEIYDAAGGLPKGVTFEKFFEEEKNVQRDIGIFARLTYSGHQHIIMAGLHQYGTWIVAEFHDQLLRGEEVNHGTYLRAEEDFIAIISGEFDSSRLKVTRVGIEEDFLWQKKGEVWERV